MNHPGQKTFRIIGLCILSALAIYWFATDGLDMLRGKDAWKKGLSPAAVNELENMAETSNEADMGIVSRVVDGDTLEMDSGEKVRLIGVDTPESKDNAKLKRDAKRTGQDAATIIKMGEEAAEFTKKLVEGEQVRLEYDVQKKDKYGRTLAYAYLLPKQAENYDNKAVLAFGRFLDDGYGGLGKASLVFVNATLVKAGYAQVMTIPPNVKYQDLFVKLEKEAREKGRGLW